MSASTTAQQGQQATAEPHNVDTQELTMHKVMSNLWIGDFASSQAAAQLTQHGITHVVAAMRQTYDNLPGIRLHQVKVDDTNTTNIIEHFESTCDFIANARMRSHGVLVHCQAGVSRSATLVAAYLMREMGLTADKAVQKIKKARPMIEPTDFFMLQLELWERCDCEWNPVKWPEERRFLMSFAQSQIMDGVSPAIVMAYYPSPSPSPKEATGADSFAFKMTPRRSSSVSSTGGSPARAQMLANLRAEAASKTMTPVVQLETPPAPRRKRLTPRSAAKQAEIDAKANSTNGNGEGPSSASTDKPAKIEKVGQKGEVVIIGRRIRCKMCRRELAGREHIITHEVGRGQQAFAPHRRDMAAHRAEMEARRRDERSRQLDQVTESQAQDLEMNMKTSIDQTNASNPPPSIAGLRISQPRPLPAGLRIAMPRPAAFERPPVAPPTAATNKDTHSLEQEQNNGNDATVPIDDVLSEKPPPAALPNTVSDPPLLPSHSCSSYFVEPLSWMSPVLETGALAGKLVCPSKKCGAKLGNYDWAGSQCSCGAWVCPGFALNVSRVDEVAR
ncbi:tyrosine protein phosphatase yvh1 [Microbotryomycetes sp. JL221]|nr:tyrosine protein phosphatase yvh1 [Microbotryomycetes sp. JL221]